MEIALRDFYPIGIGHIYDEMKIFVNTLKNKFGVLDNIKFTVGLIDAGYYKSDNGCIGAYGYIGYPCPMINFNKCDETLDIEFTVDDNWINKNKTLLDSLYVTPSSNPNASHMVWTQNKIRDSKKVTKKYGVYKKNIFDRIFAIMKENKTEFTELDLARYNSDYYNSDFVYEDIWNGDHNCVKSYECDTIEYTDTGKSNVKLSIITTDLEKNTKLLIKIIETLN